MTTLLIVVTLLSLAMAASMAFAVFRLLGEDRRRSRARVAALVEAAAANAREPLALRTPPAAREHVARRSSHVIGGASRIAQASDLPLHPAAAAPELFAEPARQASWGPRIVVAAGVLAVLLGVGATMVTERGTARQPAATVGGAAPLELLTLRHSAGGDSLTVSGVVQNPRDGIPRQRTIVSALALAADGSVMASGRAPIDVTAFGPGEESPFEVAIPVRGAVARFRIGFRAEDGSVIAHVDRRSGPEAVAQKSRVSDDAR
jgi:hypothetical protein